MDTFVGDKTVKNRRESLTLPKFRRMVVTGGFNEEKTQWKLLGTGNAIS